MSNYFTLIGEQLGNYRLLRLLGQGGSGDVYLGEHLHLNTRAAIKVLQGDMLSSDLQAFRREAQVIAALNHPHILRVLDFGVEGTLPFLVMDYAPEGTLRDRHPRGSRLPLATILSYMEQVSDALQFAHNHNVIHRDIKPENLLIGSQGEVLLSDFGIALFEQGTGQFNTPGFAGTPIYMAPEQSLGNPRKASDQYSLGLIVYEWICGHPPFSGNLITVAMQHAHQSVPPLNREIEMLNPQVEAVVMKALEKSPQDRFATIEDFANALKEAIEEPKRRIRQRTTMRAELSGIHEQEEIILTYPGEAVFKRLSSPSQPRLKKKPIVISLIVLLFLVLLFTSISVLASFRPSRTQHLVSTNIVMARKTTAQSLPTTTNTVSAPLPLAAGSLSPQGIGNMLPGSVSNTWLNGQMWLAVRENDKHIRITNGQRDYFFADTTNMTPAISYFKGQFFVAFLADDNSGLIHIFAGAITSATSCPVSIPCHFPGYVLNNGTGRPETASQSPALTSDGQNMYLAWAGTESPVPNIHTEQTSDGTTWTHLVRLKSATINAPATTICNMQQWVVYRDIGSQIHLTSNGQDYSFTDTTNDAPAATCFNGQIFVAFLADDGSGIIHIFYGAIANVMSCSAITPCHFPGYILNNAEGHPETASSAPALTTDSRTIYLSWAGTEVSAHIHIQQTEDGTSTDFWTNRRDIGAL